MLSSNSTVIYDVDALPISQNPGAASPASALYVGGSDGTNLRAFKTDTTGAQVAVGTTAVGGPPVGNPVYTAGDDGTNLRAFRTDTTGRQIVVGAAADGTAVTGNPVLIGGQDGTNVQSILTDTTGHLLVISTPTASGTSSTTSVAASAASTTLLASNTARLGATIVNDGNRNLFVKFGTTASATSFTVKIPANGYYEVPFNYTGRIDGIWDVANGSARMTELSA